MHESRRIGVADLVTMTWPPRVRVERALVDAAAWGTGARTGCGILAAGVQQRLTTASRLIVELDAAGAVRHRRILRAALLDIAGGAQAVSELDFLAFCARNGPPRPILQVVRHDPGGRRRYLDATLVGPTGVIVRVEIDGALHLVVNTYWADKLRGNELTIAGEPVMRFPSIVIHDNDRAAARSVAPSPRHVRTLGPQHSPQHSPQHRGGVLTTCRTGRPPGHRLTSVGLLVCTGRRNRCRSVISRSAS